MNAMAETVCIFEALSDGGVRTMIRPKAQALNVEQSWMYALLLRWWRYVNEL